jgi:hypothetical protein
MLLMMPFPGKEQRFLVCSLVNQFQNCVSFIGDERSLDYGYSPTIPILGESLATGGFVRWYIRRMNMVSFYVRPFTIDRSSRSSFERIIRIRK